MPDDPVPEMAQVSGLRVPNAERSISLTWSRTPMKYGSRWPTNGFASASYTPGSTGTEQKPARRIDG